MWFQAAFVEIQQDMAVALSSVHIILLVSCAVWVEAPETVGPGTENRRDAWPLSRPRNIWRPSVRPKTRSLTLWGRIWEIWVQDKEDIFHRQNWSQKEQTFNTFPGMGVCGQSRSGSGAWVRWGRFKPQIGGWNRWSPRRPGIPIWLVPRSRNCMFTSVWKGKNFDIHSSANYWKYFNPFSTSTQKKWRINMRYWLNLSPVSPQKICSSPNHPQDLRIQPYLGIGSL